MPLEGSYVARTQLRVGILVVRRPPNEPTTKPDEPPGSRAAVRYSPLKHGAESFAHGTHPPIAGDLTQTVTARQIIGAKKSPLRQIFVFRGSERFPSLLLHRSAKMVTWLFEVTHGTTSRGATQTAYLIGKRTSTEKTLPRRSRLNPPYWQKGYTIDLFVEVVGLSTEGSNQWGPPRRGKNRPCSEGGGGNGGIFTRQTRRFDARNAVTKLCLPRTQRSDSTGTSTPPLN